MNLFSSKLSRAFAAFCCLSLFILVHPVSATRGQKDTGTTVHVIPVQVIQGSAVQIVTDAHYLGHVQVGNRALKFQVHPWPNPEFVIITDVTDAANVGPKDQVWLPASNYFPHFGTLFEDAMARIDIQRQQAAQNHQPE